MSVEGSTKRAVIITENQYPCEDAGAIRQHATAKILEQLGYSVIVVGYGKSTNKKILSYDGIEYISFRPKSTNKLIRAIYRLSASSRMMHFVKKQCKDAALILVADVYPPTFKALNKYSQNKDFILVHDSVEWFSPEQFEKGERSKAYIMRDQTNKELVGKGWRVMAISSYLEEHFSKTSDGAVRIPVIMDVDSIECNLKPGADGDKIKFAYVGSPGRKDYLKNIIEGFGLLSKEDLGKVELHIVGVNKQQLVSVCGVEEKSLEMLRDILTAHGRVPHDDAIRFVRDADYTLLFRDANLRYAKAGFPTKIVESLSSGTPPVCNLSSDLGLYLKDGENSYLAEDHSPESVKIALEKAINTSSQHRGEMRANARKTAEDSFDYRLYKDKINAFLG